MRRCNVCGLIHVDDSPPCDREEYLYGKLITEADGQLTYEPPSGASECRSFNANAAEDAGLMPLSRAIPVVAHHARCTQAKARTALLETYDGEWHHTGIVGRKTKYYSVVAAIEFLRQENVGRAMKGGQ
jgi:hypothetical protein